jgi:anti-anti-sigma factor
LTIVRDSERRLRVGAHQRRQRTVVLPVGEIDLATSGLLRDSLAQCDGHVIVDLAGVTFLDASGIGALASDSARLHRCGGSLVLRDPKPAVRRVIEQVGLASWIVH